MKSMTQERNMMMKKEEERMKTVWNDDANENEKSKTDINDEYQKYWLMNIIITNKNWTHIEMR